MKDVILLHGALGCNSHWNHVLPYLHPDFKYHNLNFPLHGGSDSVNAELTLVHLSNFVSSYILEKQLHSFVIVGYSMGGYVGLDLAIKHLNGLKMLITLGTKLNWNETIAETQVAKLSLEKLSPIHAKLEQEHGVHWQKVIAATHNIMRSIGKKPIKTEHFEHIEIPVCLLLAEQDNMVTAEETKRFSDSGQTCSFNIIAGQPHLLEKVDGELLARKINELLLLNQVKQKFNH